LRAHQRRFNDSINAGSNYRQHEVGLAQALQEAKAAAAIWNEEFEVYADTYFGYYRRPALQDVPAPSFLHRVCVVNAAGRIL
jgi:hypothetical protein